MIFHSILFEQLDRIPQDVLEAPVFFGDLNLDQIVESVTAEFKDYELGPFYYTRLNDLEAISYRQEIMRDLDDESGMQAVRSFSEKMRSMRAFLDQTKQLHHYEHSATRRFLAAVDTYCEAVEHLAQDLSSFGPKSRGLRRKRQSSRQICQPAVIRELYGAYG
jgi:DNA mismatch repair protein MutS